MSIKQRGMIFWTALAVTLLGLIVLLVRLIVRGDTHPVDVVGFLFGAALPTLSFLYTLIQRHSLRFYITMCRLQSLIHYNAPTWNLSVRLSGKNLTAGILDEVVTKLTASPDSTETVRVRTLDINTRSVIISRGPNLEIRYHPPATSPLGDEGDKEAALVQVLIDNYHVGYRETAYVLGHKILPLLEQIAGVIQGADARYSLVVEFDKGQNPFFGLYIARLPLEAISKFVINLTVSEKPRETVLISETKIAINTQSQHTLHSLALEFLTFQPSLKERLDHA